MRVGTNSTGGAHAVLWARFILLPISLLLWPYPAHGDGGTVRFSGRVGAYQLTVFTAPNPFRSGPVDISILVQDPDTTEPVADARVQLWLTAEGQTPLRYEATRAAATNKLLHSAKFDLPAAGHWHADVHIDGGRGSAQAPIDLDAGEPWPAWSQLWAWMILPAVAVLLFLVHQVLTRRASAARSGMDRRI